VRKWIFSLFTRKKGKPLTTTTLKLSEWNIFPFGELRAHYPLTSGETYREDFLLPALKTFDTVYVDFGEIISPGSSWLVGCFGPLTDTYSVEELKQKLKFKNTSQVDKGLIWRYIRE